MTDIKRVGSSGIHTIEGNVAGTRAAELTREREKQQALYEAVKNKIKDENTHSIGRIDTKFSSATDVQEQEFRKKTVGLVTADEFRKAQAEIAEMTRQSKVDREQEEKQIELNKKADRDLKRKKVSSTMSFSLDEEGDGEEEDTFVIKKKVTKNPNVDTSFLPDAARDKELEEKKEALRVQWLKEQEEMKKEPLEVVYSYWDGSGHRKSLTVHKGMTIGKFLEQVKAQLNSEFREIRSSNAEDLCYVKEDLIIPQHISFYDLIVTKARGKSGPLFYFDVHDDVRLVNDATVEKEESHPGKVVERRWYEKNKHIFPYSRWEWYDPKVTRDSGYSLYSLDK